MWTGNEDGNTVYAVFNQCSILTVNDGDSIPWDAEITDLLAGVAVNDPAATVILPAGWQDLGAGPLVAAYDLSLTVIVDGVERQLELTQMAGTTIGSLAAQRSIRLAEPIDVNGADGWLFQAAGSRYIGWQTSTGTAVRVGGETQLVADQLRGIAARLEPGHATAWEGLLSVPDSGGVTEAIAVTESALRAACGEPSLGVD